MGKLGKKARKFAKKNLQSVLRRNRKTNSKFKKKASKKEVRDATENQHDEKSQFPKERNDEDLGVTDLSLDHLFGKDHSDVDVDDSGSDGYLSEDSSNIDAPGKSQTSLEDSKSNSAYMAMEKSDMHLELAKKKKRLDKLKEKNPKFAKYLESFDKVQEHEIYLDDDNVTEDRDTELLSTKLMSASSFDSLCQQVTDKQSIPALTSLLNGYRAACHYGSGSASYYNDTSLYGIQNSESFSKILIFILREADAIFRSLLGVSSLKSREIILNLKSAQKWDTLKPMIKSYFRSTLFLLNQISDSQLLGFAMARLRASLVFFAAFPSLLHRLIKISVHLWATGKGTLSSISYLVIHDVASMFGSNWFDISVSKVCRTFISHCKFFEPGLFEHIQFLKKSVVELCSLDVQKSSSKGLCSIELLAKILHVALRTKEKEAVKKLCSWEYTNCIDIWVEFICANFRDYDLQPLLFTISQIINGVACLFLGPRYLPLRVKCIQWLNHLSRSCGVFIPIASLALDILEYKVGKEGKKPERDFDLSSSVKLPKYWLKSQNFQEQCVVSAVELLCVHFDQWSYHISFPELATVPLIRMRKFHEITNTENLRRVVKRFIDQVEQNIDFVRKKRDDVAFSPKDQQLAESFLQFERGNSNVPFKQYYRSIIQKAASENFAIDKSLRVPEQEKSVQQQPPNGKDTADDHGKVNGQMGKNIRKKRKTRS